MANQRPILGHPLARYLAGLVLAVGMYDVQVNGASASALGDRFMVLFLIVCAAEVLTQYLRP